MLADWAKQSLWNMMVAVDCTTTSLVMVRKTGFCHLRWMYAVNWSGCEGIWGINGLRWVLKCQTCIINEQLKMTRGTNHNDILKDYTRNDVLKDYARNDVLKDYTTSLMNGKRWGKAIIVSGIELMVCLNPHLNKRVKISLNFWPQMLP